VVTPTAGSVVLVTFPFSDLSQAKLRPAIVLADVGRGDWILCQITSNPYSDPAAIQLDNSDFQSGSLQRTSYIRPGRLFTANSSLMQYRAGLLKSTPFNQTIYAVISMLQANIK
jgi:mRNA interferase MazF